MRQRTNRRDFLKATTAAGVGFWVAGGVSPPESRAAIETINFGCVGVGGKGTSDAADASREGNIVAICDIDENSLNKAARRYSSAQKYFDCRKMLDEMGKTIDAITVSTPDHTHTVPTAMALQQGIACYTQKPMTHSIYEARLLGHMAAKYKVATQMGNQGTALPNLRKAAAQIQSGCLGKVSEVHVWTNRPIWPQGLSRPTETETCPPEVHWDLFIGPAPMRPYSQVYHPFKWRGWWDFGTGALGDMACHTLNMPFAALDLRDPISVMAQTSGHNKETYPSWSIIEYEFPATDARAAVKLFWYDGKKLPPEGLLKGEKMVSSGSLIVGEKGSLYAPGDYAEKELKYLGVEAPDVEFKKSPGHFKEFAQAIKGDEPAMSNFPDYASPLTETVLLGNLAVWADGKKIEWDAKNMVATNAPEVAEIIRPEYHNGYTLDAIA
jgi:predicted dehydrogenase